MDEIQEDGLTGYLFVQNEEGYFEMQREGSGKTLPLMQFTGQKDADGKELYEGEILGIEGKPELNREVYYEPEMGAFGMRLLDYQKRTWERPYQPLTQEWINTVEARSLGNVFENPELLDSSDPSAISRS